MIKRVFMIAIALAAGAALCENTNNPTSRFDRAEWGPVEFKDGARGTVEVDPAQTHKSSASLKITKTNGVGYILIRSRNPLKISNGKKYTLRTFFRSENAPISSLLIMRLGGKTDESFANPYGFYSYLAESQIPNSPPGEWQKRILNFTCAKDRGDDPNIVKNYPEGSHLVLAVYGNPATVWLDSFEVGSQRTWVSTKREKYKAAYDKEQVNEILAKREPVELRINLKDGRTTLVNNGKPAAPTMFMASENNALVGDFGGFGKAGVQMQIVPVPFIDPAAPARSFWRGKGQYDFTALDRPVYELLKKNPQADVVVHFWVYPYQNWGAENPDDCWMDKAGRKAYHGLGLGYIQGFDDQIPAGKTSCGFYPSYNSEKWRMDTCEALKAALAHMAKQPYAKVVAGFYFFAGIDGRLQPWPADYSSAELKSFKTWCEKKYGTAAKLSAAWSERINSFDEISIGAGGGAMVLPGVPDSISPYLTDRKAKDYQEYRLSAIWGLVDSWCGTVKDKWGGPVLTFAYRDLDIGFLNTKSLDFCGNDSQYPTRRAGYAAGCWYPVRTDFLRKYWMLDIDLRSYAGPQIVDEEYENYIGAGLTKESWTDIHKKLTGMCLAKNTGYWYFDMCAFFQNKDIMAEIAAVQKVAKHLEEQKKNDAFTPDVAVVIKGGPRGNHSVFNNIVECTFGDWGFNVFQGMELGCSGVPHDLMYLDTLMNNKELQKYKVYVFMQTAYLSRDEREFIQHKLKGGKRTLIWVYDSGYLSEKGEDIAAMSELAGITIRTEEKFERLTPILEKGSEFTDHAAPFQGAGELMHACFTLHGLNPSGIAAAQPFWIEDPAATTFARFSENGRSAMAFKRFADWTSIVLAAPNSLGGDLLNNIAKQAGAFVCGEAGQSVFMNGNFISIHCMKSGPFTIKLPPDRSKVMEPFTGRELSKGSPTYTLDMLAGKTYWLMFE